MDSVKYIGMDVHKEAISIAVLNWSGKLVMECTIETKAVSILDFLKGLRGSPHVTLEEGTWATWLYDLIKPHLTKLVVCNPRRNALLKEGSKSDCIDARKLAELLRSNSIAESETDFEADFSPEPEVCHLPQKGGPWYLRGKIFLSALGFFMSFFAFFVFFCDIWFSFALIRHSNCEHTSKVGSSVQHCCRCPYFLLTRRLVARVRHLMVKSRLTRKPDM